MGLFDFLKPRPATVPNSNELRQMLLAAIGDPGRLFKLCKQHRELIAQYAGDWKTVPVEMRKDAGQVNAYVQSILAIAGLLKERLNDARCMNAFVADEPDNVLARIDTTLERARTLAAELQTDAAVELLNDLLIETRQLVFFGPHALRGLIHGQLGATLFHAGRPRDALGHFEQALKACREQNDANGVLAYLHSLYEVHRYLGEPAAAAGHADELARLYQSAGDDDAARRFGAAARRAREGEPLLRMAAAIGERTYEIDELVLPENVKVQVNYVRNRITLGNSEALTQRGREAGAAGRDDDALADFRDAAKVDPFNPDPHYLAGLALLKLQRFHEAVEEYETTESLAPGWFQVQADLWLARELAVGRLDHAVFLGIWYLADGPAPPQEKLDLVRQMLEKWPDVPALHLIHGQALAALDRNDEAIAALRAGLAHDPEPDVHTRLLSELAQRIEDTPERRRLLEQAVALNGNLAAATMARIMLKARG